MPSDKPRGLLGAHTSTSGGVCNALREGHDIGATTIQIFTANQKQWKPKRFSEEMAKEWNEQREPLGLSEIMSHASYLINLGSPREEVLEKSRLAFPEELKRCHDLNIRYLNFHPGAALTEPEEACIDRIVDSLLQFEELAAAGDTILLLENTAGQGSVVGWRFEQLRAIIEGVKERLPIGVCIDTCHAFAAGYDIRTADAWEKTLKEFDDVVGLDYLYAFHLNDSKNDIGTRKDRHETLGNGYIGKEAFEVVMTHPATSHLPKYLETPGGPEQWKKEIAWLSKL